jgi:hypothetical protein
MNIVLQQSHACLLFNKKCFLQSYLYMHILDNISEPVCNSQVNKLLPVAGLTEEGEVKWLTTLLPSNACSMYKYMYVHIKCTVCLYNYICTIWLCNFTNSVTSVSSLVSKTCPSAHTHLSSPTHQCCFILHALNITDYFWKILYVSYLHTKNTIQYCYC